MFDAVNPAVVDNSTETPPTVIVPPVRVVCDAVKLIPVVTLVIEGVRGILSVEAHTNLTTPSPKSVAWRITPLAEKEAFNWSATIDEISAVVRFCGRADAAVKLIAEEAKVPVVIRMHYTTRPARRIGHSQRLQIHMQQF